MSERERWVVYPLLFLALGAALRDKLVDSTITKRIVCQELTVVDEEPVGMQPVGVIARIGRTDPVRGQPPTGYLVLNGQLEADVVNANQYAYNGRPFIPSLAGIFPWTADLMRSLPRGSERPKLDNAEPEPQPAQTAAPEPPATPSNSAPSATPPAGEAAQPTTEQ